MASPELQKGKPVLLAEVGASNFSILGIAFTAALRFGKWSGPAAELDGYWKKNRTTG